MSVLTKFVSRTNLHGARVDREKGIVYGVSLCSVGEAIGHKKFCDKTTLKQLGDCINEYSSGLRISFDPSTFNHGGGSTMIGFVPGDTFRVKGNQAFGDIHVFAKAPKDTVEFFYELAERTPDLIGLSVEFSGVDEDKEGKTFARCDEIYAARIVDLPAANPTGLFSVKSNDNEDMNMTDEQLTKLSTGIATAVIAGLKPVITEFRAKASSESTEKPSSEEMAAAGCTDTDSEEDKEKKVKEYRANLDKPVTARTLEKSLISFFARTGGRPVSHGGGEGAKVGKDDSNTVVTQFEDRINKFKEGGASAGQAIAMARKVDPKGFNEFSRVRRGTASGYRPNPEKKAAEAK